MIDFLVGPQKVRFRVHDNVLRQAQAGDFLAIAFCDGFYKTKELLDDGPAEFRFFVNSLYGLWTELTESPFKCEDLEFAQKLKLYVFAHKYDCHDFQNAIMSSLHDFEPVNHWRSTICRHDLERFVADVPNGSSMHKFLADWLIQDMFNMQPGANHIEDEFLEELPAFLMRAALKHMLTYEFPRSLNKKMPLKVKAKGKYLLPEDNQVQERKRELPVDDTIPYQRPPAGGWRHSSAPPACKRPRK